MLLTSFSPILATIPLVNNHLSSNSELLHSTEVFTVNYSSNLFVIIDAWRTGVWKGLFLALPLSVSHFLIWRVTYFRDWKIGVFGVFGKCLGELLLIYLHIYKYKIFKF